MMKQWIIFVGLGMGIMMGCDKPAVEEEMPTEPTVSFGAGSLGENLSGETSKMPSLNGGDAIAGTGSESSQTEIKLKVKETVTAAKTVMVKNDNVHVTESVSGDAANPLAAKRRDGIQVIQPTPANSLAAKLALSEKRFLWNPTARPGGEFLGHPWLIAAALSGDRTVLAVVERTGADHGPYGSRIVLINTCNLTVMNVLEVETLVSKIAVHDAAGSLFALCEAQPELKQGHRVVEISLKNGLIQQTLRMSSASVTGWLLSEKARKLFLLQQGENAVTVYPLSHLSPAYKKEIPFNGIVNRIGLSESDNTLTLFSKDLLTHCALSDLSPYETRTVSLESVKAVFNMGSRERWVIFTENGKSLFLNNTFQMPIAEKAGDFAFRDPVKQLVFSENQLQSAIGIWQQTPWISKGEIAPLKLWPRSAAPVFFADWIPYGARILWFDRAGGLFLFMQTPRGNVWTKVSVLEPKR